MASEGAGLFRDAPGGQPDECPQRMLERRDPWRDEVIGLAGDYEAGVVEGWPDRYAAWIVDGVRYVLAESRACANKLMEARD